MKGIRWPQKKSNDEVLGIAQKKRGSLKAIENRRGRIFGHLNLELKVRALNRDCRQTDRDNRELAIATPTDKRLALKLEEEEAGSA